MVTSLGQPVRAPRLPQFQHDLGTCQRVLFLLSCDSSTTNLFPSSVASSMEGGYASCD